MTPCRRAPPLAARLAVLLPLALAALPARLAAQTWDSPLVDSIVARAITRREAMLADTALRDFTARAHGFLFFLGQMGEGLAEPPRLIKADQLELRVYWKAPDLSRQVIIGWRDRKTLPTDIEYHNDHLGIALNNFPDRIRIGQGDEVRDIPHPLAPNGPAIYRYALQDSLTIQLPGRALRVYEVLVQPRDFHAPRMVGSMLLDADDGDLVRMSFEFTRSAYRDPELEDITVSIENSLQEGRFWLPWRQEISIRRRATWLDFPVRGIIQGHWEIGDYHINQGISDSVFYVPGPPIIPAPLAQRAQYRWPDSLGAAIQGVAVAPGMRDLAAIRARVEAVAMGHAINGLKQTQLFGAAVSDFAHYDRVEGLALGTGLTLRGGNDANVLRLNAGAATATTLFTGGLDLEARRGTWTWRVDARRAVRDLGDVPVISGVMNSLSAQETGADFGDYYLATGGTAGGTLDLGGRATLGASLGWERIGSLATHARWARGTFGPNPSVGGGQWTLARVTLSSPSPSFTMVPGFSGRVDLEGGAGSSAYLRAFSDASWHVPVGHAWLVARASAGAGTRDLPAHRAFVLGGRGTLLGEGFRAYAGRVSLWGSLEARLPVPIPELSLGSFAGTGPTLTLIPFAAAGWVGEPTPLLLGGPSRGVRPVVGLGVAWFHDLVRLDAGWGLATHRLGWAVDVTREFWSIL